MHRLNKILYFVYFLSSIDLCGQSGRRVYLGPGMDSLFEKGSFHYEVIDSQTVFRGLGSERLYYETADDSKKDLKVINAGLILKAKSIEKSGRGMRSVFTNGVDSCEVLYEVRTDITRVGRSAALSIFNLFAKSEDKIPQSDPIEQTDLFQVSGKIATEYFDQPFEFTNIHPNSSYHPQGWLALNEDTLYVKPITNQINKRGKMRHPKNIPNIGYLLMKGGTIYAAIDECQSPFVCYILARLNQVEKLVIIAFLVSTMVDGP